MGIIQKPKRVYQKNLWRAAKFYSKEAEKCYRAKAYFSVIVNRGCALEALLRIFDFVETPRPKDRCKNFYWLINRALARHWIPHDALRYWKQQQETPLKTCLHEVREVRNGVHAHLFDIRLVSRRTAMNVSYVVDAMFAFLEIKNARNLMENLHRQGKISNAEYRAWKKKQTSIAE